LIGISVIVFIIQQITNLWIYLAFIPAFALQAPWMFLTSIFLHAGFSHLLFNMFSLFFFGIYLEKIVSREVFLAIFLLSGIAGSFGYMLTAADPFGPGLGASGAVYGVMGALAVLAPRMIIFVYGFLPLPMIVAAILYAIIDYAGLFVPSGIAHGAHLGGMFVGGVFGLYLRSKWKPL
jgi:membrane associated rhomboid family serine protease